MIPPSIPVENGRLVFTTDEGLNAICALGEHWRTEDKDRRVRIGPERMPQLAVNEFGRMLQDNGGRLWEPDAYRETVRTFKQRLDAALAAAARDATHYFPCHVVQSPQAASFAVGPVRFMRRREWLDQVAATAGRDLGWLDAVSDHWENGSAVPSSSGHDGLTAGTIIDAIRTQWIASVSVKGNELGRSAERATYAVRLAIDALSLPLRRDLGLDLRGPGDELRVTKITRFSQFPGLDLNIGGTLDMPDLFSHPPQAEEFLTGTSELRDDAGWAIESVIVLERDTELADLRRRWCDALYWFGDARRDRTGFAALVRYGMALDVLAKGSKANGITEMVCGLFDRTETSPIMSDGMTLKAAVEAIYNEGRSQFGHGGRPALLEDLPFPREGADHLVRLALDAYLWNLRRYLGTDDADEFLQAIPLLVASGKTG